MTLDERYERLKKEVAYLFEKFEEEVGIGQVQTFSGGGPTTPPTQPGGK